MSENYKPRLDHLGGDHQNDRLTRAAEAANSGENAATDDAESQMRRALGLLGEQPRHRPEPERTESVGRIGGGFNSGLHRRRFVQDGDIPVTVLRRDQGHEAPGSRGTTAAAAPTSSRLQRIEAQLASETAAREKAERALSETQALLRDVQTKIGHAELAKNEAIEALRREREGIAQLRADAAAWEERLHEALGQARAAERSAESYHEQLVEERQARQDAEKALRASEASREEAEQLVRALSEKPAPIPMRRPRAEPEVAAATMAAATLRRKKVAVPADAEPEPVKWWLNTKPTRRR